MTTPASTRYGSIERDESKELISEELNWTRKKWLSLVPFVCIFVTTSFMYATHRSYNQTAPTLNTKETNKNARTASGDIATSWTLYKYTTSIPPESYVTVQSFINQYITEASFSYNLGCNATYKVVGSIGTPTSDIGLSGFQELHWVDSSVFETTGMSVSDWSTYVSSLGYDKINPFMLNKVQLYVPDLLPHYTALAKDGITVILRKSQSKGATEADTAHIGIPVANTATIYELVGPISSLSDDQQEGFVAWSTSECVGVHQLPYNISTYAELYNTIVFNDTAALWMEETGKYVPMGVAITIPTQSLDYITDTMNIVTGVTTFLTTEYSADDCDVMAMDMYSDGQSEFFGPYVRYVDATSAMTVTGKDVSDWESDVSDTHDFYLDMDATYSRWDRYLDTHLGMMTEITDEGTGCSDNEGNIKSILASSVQDPAYSARESGGVHFYTATKGLKAWEFNLFGCSSDYTNICGCLADNNEDEFLVDNSACYDEGYSSISISTDDESTSESAIKGRSNN